jgi:hypothetical protein
MIDREPLEEWLFRVSYAQPPDEREQALLRQDLAELEAWLDAPATDKRRVMPLVRGRWFSAARLEPDELPRAQELYRRVVAATGTNKTYAEESLLSLIASALEPSTIPFFVEMLDLAPPRDKQAARRRQLSLAALALLAIQREEPAAYAALRTATQHPNPAVRAQAVYYLGRTYQRYDDEIELGNIEETASERPLALEDMLSALSRAFTPDHDPDAVAPEGAEEAEEPPPQPVPPDVAAELTAIAVGDKAFEPRFLARQILRRAGEPVPLDNRAGAYAFKVKFRGDKRVYRTIALKSEQTLEDLHVAIQRAIKWDDDHLYAFFMNGQLYDERYQFASPWDRDAAAWTNEAVIGELGLTLKHKFLYFFDYGDSHEFEVEVVDIKARAERGKYPRVVDSQGQPPAQYWYGDESDELDDDE